jgi:tetratricopeptide (TPR) repeat protein
MRLLIILLFFSLFSCNSVYDAKKIGELNNEGVFFLESKNYASALVKFQEALALKPIGETKSQVLRNISTVYFYLDEIDSAKYYSKLAYQSTPKNTYDYHLNYGEYLMLEGKIKSAIIEFEKAIKINPNNMEAYNNFSLIYDGSFGDEFTDDEKALYYSQKAFELNPSPITKEQLAAVHFQQDNYKESNRLFKELMDSYPEIKMNQFNYGMSLYFSGDEVEGLKLMYEASLKDSQCSSIFKEMFDSEIVNELKDVISNR